MSVPRRRGRSGALLALTLVVSSGMAVGQLEDQADEEQQHERIRGAPVVTSRRADDAVIPLPGTVGPTTDVRLFVEAFLVAFCGDHAGEAYDLMLGADLRSKLTRDHFLSEAAKLRGIAGPLEYLVILYLREAPASARFAEGGYAEYMLAFADGRRSKTRVEFHHDPSGVRRIISFVLEPPSHPAPAEADPSSPPPSPGAPPAGGTAPQSLPPRP